MAAAEAQSPGGAVDGGPPLEALAQSDGSFILEEIGGPSLRWTKRADGTWRKPERIGKHLERPQYSLAAMASTVAPGLETAEGEAGAKEPLPLDAITNDLRSALGMVVGGSGGGGTAGSAGGGDAESSSAKKHNLHQRWSLWVHERPGQSYNAKDYQDAAWSTGQRRVHDISTVEDFWCMIHYSHSPSKLLSSDYSLFRHQVTPAWEDSAFKRGGRWVVKLEKLKTETLDELWVLLTMALIGEGFADYGGDSVSGAIVSVRNRGSKAALWLSESARVERVLAIGHHFRHVLSEAPGLGGLAASNLTFEYFGRQHATLELPELFRGKSTIGIFQ